MERSDKGEGNVMAYVKPNYLTRRLVNPVVSRLHTGGVQTLTVAGRRTGRPHSVPVIPVQVGEDRYLVSPYGQADWVRNLRAAGECELQGNSAAERFAAREVPIAQRAAVIAAYRDVAGRTVEPCFRELPKPADHPVFVVERLGSSA